MSRLQAERVRDVVLNALVDYFGDNADRFDEDPMRLGVVFGDGTFVEVKVLERRTRAARFAYEAYCDFIVGEQHGEPVKCEAVRAVHGDALGMATHEFVAPPIGARRTPSEAPPPGSNAEPDIGSHASPVPAEQEDTDG